MGTEGTHLYGDRAPHNLQYVVLVASANLTQERVLTGTANQITVTDNGAGSTVVLSLPSALTIPGTLDSSYTNTVAAGDSLINVHIIQGDDDALTGTLRGAYITASNGDEVATGTIRGAEIKARAGYPGETGANVNVLEGFSISSDAKTYDVTTHRGGEIILDGGAGTSTLAVGLRIANNFQANRATTSYGLQIYRDSFDYTADIQLSSGGLIGGASGHMVVTSAGKVGIGTSDPNVLLHIISSSAPAELQRSSDNSLGSGFIVRKTRGTGTSPTIVQDGDQIAKLLFTGYDGTAHRSAAQIIAYVDGTPGASDMPGAISFQTTIAGEVTPRSKLYMTNDGKVGIGLNLTTPTAQLHIDQSSTTAAVPVLILDQADVSEEMIEFISTIGVGNALEAVGGKTLTTTHFIKVTLPGGLTRYLPVGTIS